MPSDAEIGADLLMEVEAAMCRLTRRQREVMPCLLGQKSHTEMAQELGITRRAVSYRVVNARKRLHKVLRENLPKRPPK